MCVEVQSYFQEYLKCSLLLFHPFQRVHAHLYNFTFIKAKTLEHFFLTFMENL